MKNSRVAIGAIVLLSVAAMVAPLTAAHAFGRGGGGGGGGGHFGGGGGGGHFGGGGGGMHFGGGGGGMHFGGGGGGMHLGGGGMHLGGGGMRLGGGGLRLGGGGTRLGGLSHLGGTQLGGGRIGGLRGGGGGARLGGLSSGRLSGGAGGGLQSGLAGRGLQGGLGGRGLQGGRVAGLGAGALGTHALMNNNGMGGGNRLGGGNGLGGRNGMGGGRGFGNGMGRGFGNGMGGGRFGGGFGGWVGPVFWPYAYSDISCGVFWGYWGYGCGDPYWGLAYGNPFWDYGYGDIFTGGIFSPFGFDDLAGYLPGATGYSPGARVAGRRTRSNVASASEQIAEMCGNDNREVADWPIDRIRQLVSPDNRQNMALDDLANASVQAAQIIKTSCPTSVAFTPTGRLEAMQQRIEGMEQAIDVVQGPLDKFYDALTDEQKAKLDAANPNQAPAQRNARPAGLAENCGKNAATEWPEGRIEAAVRPNEEQLNKLRALRNAATQAAAQLAASCPSELPTTPPARLAAVSKRLDVMLQSVKSVRGALDDFYGDLSDEQKAQFNKIGPSRTAQR